ncbi:GNAT family N-acetyltransferase [Cupriavidus necator]|uniref:GNAT family N-acetyltransferase n=1 Tax=Cupriavidus necator TaxID=106590 RepID=UPI00339D80F0
MTVTIRRAVADDVWALATVHARCWHETYRQLLPDELLRTVTPERRFLARVRVLSDPTVGSFVACRTEAGDVIGFADCGPLRNSARSVSGEIYALYVLASHHGAGIGFGLFAACVRELLGRGYISMKVYVLADNEKARRFYEETGGRYETTVVSRRGEIYLEEAVYGWDYAAMAQLVRGDLTGR